MPTREEADRTIFHTKLLKTIDDARKLLNEAEEEILKYYKEEKPNEQQ